MLLFSLIWLTFANAQVDCPTKGQPGRSVLDGCSLPSAGNSIIFDHTFFGEPAHQVKMNRLNSSDPPKIEFAIAIDFDEIDTVFDMRKRVEQCYQEAQPFLKGPHGEQLIFRLAKKSERLKSGIFHLFDKKKKLAPLAVKLIENAPKHFRSDAKDLSVRADCPTILHESLHWLGLADEYPETEYDYSCRSLGPEDSVMYNPLKAYSVVRNCVDTSAVVVIKVGKQTVERAIGKIKTGDGAGTSRPLSQASSAAAVHCENAPGMKTKNSLLRPSQFNKIVYPNCIAFNWLYQTCADGAYLSKKSFPGCRRGLPAECLNKNW